MKINTICMTLERADRLTDEKIKRQRKRAKGEALARLMRKPPRVPYFEQTKTLLEDVANFPLLHEDPKLELDVARNLGHILNVVLSRDQIDSWDYEMIEVKLHSGIMIVVPVPDQLAMTDATGKILCLVA